MSIMSVRERRMLRIKKDEILFIRGYNGVIGVAKSAEPRSIYMGTPEGEIVLSLDEDDLIAVSAFETGPRIEKAIKCMIHLLREIGAPLIVLEEGHPTSKRLKMVVSAGETIKLDCNITPGTHPEQELLCSTPELSGTMIKAAKDGIILQGKTENMKIEKVNL
ncbi:hypothetical protein MTTB_09920 [Methanothermobacter tenebrarum]|uniref:Uncharacterized protein n=1 Tax=Methanothermobacter tenebrarum TaxID=680118 RepID=A0ABM7YEC4_9EURY|nr:hypothetical protein [Methanothermobacter tenebrarum]MDI6881339.1 hypothetical protein [Methanothermobacter sp.]BDH79613.1 hypothetical protein MTTB_09920 [Methanothermobacter tenebrarum]HOQ20707.1 hypothetical protein [Methanothermobacter sp.]